MTNNLSDKPHLVEHYQRLVEAIQHSTECVLYKGCSSFDEPHPEAPVIYFDNYRFYAEPLPLKSEEAAKLTALCCNPAYFKFTGERWFCDFHEDYAVEWRADGQTIQLIFCFSCDEVYGRYKAGAFMMGMRTPAEFRALFPPLTPEAE